MNRHYSIPNGQYQMDIMSIDSSPQTIFIIGSFSVFNAISSIEKLGILDYSTPLGSKINSVQFKSNEFKSKEFW
ncbi:hypothetical protein DERF_007978 [Dermatophagoides farinae]|uniref:Uncharacterized protein n=1 Tax=Dermatophagoides farinae TaxID=6954 RepID=A0A922HZ08_DERFA|nr:hypothetical protein DERF_007978 [Dermatophagoides farinae]